MAPPNVQYPRGRASTSMLILALWLIALICVPMHADATMPEDHGHADCAASCCAHPGMVADVPGVPPETSCAAPERVFQCLGAATPLMVQQSPSGPAPLSRGRPPDLQVFLA